MVCICCLHALGLSSFPPSVGQLCSFPQCSLSNYVLSKRVVEQNVGKVVAPAIVCRLCLFGNTSPKPMSLGPEHLFFFQQHLLL
jgi:hypothetical protein